MKFETICSDVAGKAYDALLFLKKAHDNNSLSKIENMEYVFNCLDIAGDLEHAIQKLKEYNINY